MMKETKQEGKERFVKEKGGVRKMKRYREKERGITLVALVITVIIIIILATVTINMAFGDNGLITQAQKAKDMTANSVVAEQEGMNSVMSEYLNIMEEDSEITPPEPEVPEIPGGEEAVEQGAIAFTNLVWSKEKASVTISTNTSYTLQYQVVANEGASSEENWQAVPEGGIIGNLNHRDVVYARLVQGSYYGEEASTTIKDETPPTISNVELTSTENSVTVTVTASDSESGIGTYTYTINGGSQASNSSNTHTFTGLSASTSYTVQVTVTDRANNPVTDSKSITTKAPSGIPETTSYVGYYADVNGDNSVDGIIYADLAIGGSGEWNPGNNSWATSNNSGDYTIPKKSGLKKYKVEGTYNGDFGNKGIVKPNGGSGNERFYVMALEDIDKQQNGTYYSWYESAYGNMSDYATYTSGDFGAGEQNTSKMITKWNASGYGSQNADSSYPDVWGLSAVQSGTWNGSSGWYVPSRGEWAAFGGELGITQSNYSSKGLSNYYWSSSQYNTFDAWAAYFNNGCMGNGRVDGNGYVRLGTTF